MILSEGISVFSNVGTESELYSPALCSWGNGRLAALTGPRSDSGQTKSCLLVTYTIRDVHLSVLYESSVLHG